MKQPVNDGKNLTLNISPDTKDITIREGEAPHLPVAHPKPINITGTLQAPFQYFEGKNPEAINSHILIENDKGKLTLKIDDRNSFSECVIIGSLKEDNTLQEFGINTTKRYSIQDFLRFIKQFRYYFADRAAHTALIESIQKWSVKIERVINEYNDNKGNSNFHLETKVQAVDGLVTFFDLNIPIFQGYPKVKFTVEIGLDPKNTAVQLYLISEDLYELETKEREGWIAHELKKFDGFKCSKIVIS